MISIVLDASVALKWFLEEKGTNVAEKILKQIKRQEINVYVPQIFFFEIINVIKTKSRSNSKDVLQVINKISSLNFISKKVNKLLLTKANFYAQKYDLTIYDASYVALAKINKIMFVTADQKLVKKTKLNFIKNLNKFRLAEKKYG